MPTIIYLFLTSVILFFSFPAVAAECPDGWTPNGDGTCNPFGGGGFGGGGGGGTGSFGDPVPSGQCGFGGDPKYKSSSPAGVCDLYYSEGFWDYPVHYNGDRCVGKTGTPLIKPECGVLSCPPDYEMKDGKCVRSEGYKPKPPDFPDLPPPPQDGTCNACQALYEIRAKLNYLKNTDINNITNITNDMSTIINNIDNSINDLSVNQETINNYLTNIDNSMGDLVTNIENNNITNNQIKNDITNIYNTMNEYSLQLGDLQLALDGINLSLGDIDAQIGSNNRLLVDLGLDLDFIKNKIATDDSKDYTPYLETIIELLNKEKPNDSTDPTDPTEPPEPYDDTELIRLLTELNDFVRAEPDDLTHGGVDVQDLTDLIDIDNERIKFTAQCPTPKQISVTVAGLSFSDELSYEPMCDFFSRLRPFVVGMGTISMILLIAGGARRG